MALESAPIQLDPRVGTDQASSRVYELMANGLVTKDVDGNFVPDLAESWEVLDDARRYRFHLRSGVRFHDGRPFTAADVVWTFQSLLDGTVVSAKRGAIPQLERVVEIDPSTVDFLLREPFGALVSNLTSYLGIVPKGTTPEAMSARPVGTGPWRLVERSPSLDRLVFEAFDGYFGGRPKLDRLILREVPEATVRVLELRKGSVQLTINNIPPDVLPLLESDPDFQVPRRPGANYVYIGLNLTDPALARPAVRRALELALDRELLVRSLWRGLGVVTETILPPGHWARNDELPLAPFDPPQAMRLLDQAGLPDPDGPEGPKSRLSLTYKTSTDETALLQAQILQSMWARVGVAVDIRSYEFATFYNDIKRGNFQMFSLTWTGVADPDIYSLILHTRAFPPAGANRGHYSNPEFDALVEAGRRLADPVARRPFYLRAQAILARDLPYLSLFTKVNHAVLPRGLAGYEHYPSGELYSLRKMWWADGGALTPSASAPRR
ncbi:MAG: ABC transporter substrate-binding protein [Thermoanaerobaculia bacterium]